MIYPVGSGRPLAAVEEWVLDNRSRNSQVDVIGSSRSTNLLVVVEQVAGTALQRTLEEAGYSVQVIGPIEGAANLLAMSSAGIAIVDIDALGNDLPEICQWIRQATENAFFPVVLLSEGSDAVGLRDAFAAGAMSWIPKPVDSDLLLAQVARLEIWCKRFECEMISGERFERIQTVANVGLWEWSAGEKRLTWSRGLDSILGQELDGQTSSFESFLDWVHSEDRGAVEEAITRAMEEGSDFDIEHRILLENGQIRFVHHRAQHTQCTGPGQSLLVGTIQDISDRQAAKEQMCDLAYFDHLTGLPNRVLSKDRLGVAIHQAERNGRMVALLLFDLDHFKRINGTLSRATGDSLLQKVAERLKHSVRGGDSVGVHDRSYGVSRMGGDEFTVLLNDLLSPDVAPLVAGRILQSLSNPFLLDGHEIHVSASIGIAFYPNDGSTPDALFEGATSALEVAKQRVGNSFEYFDTSMSDTAKRKLMIESGLHRAVANGEFSLCYQPRYHASAQKICGMEALLRWNHPTMGWIPPGEFIGIAEESGLISSIGEWVLRTACLANKRWQEQGLLEMPVAVNLSSYQFRDGDIAGLVLDILEETGLSPRFLELEITEGILLENRKSTSDALARLRDTGIRIALDDFGTGYSSLSYVKDFPLDTIKIDRVFIKNLGEGLGDGAIVKAIVAMAHSLGLRVVAEGVETLSQLEIVTEYACDEIQGFFFSRPVPQPEFAQLLSVPLS